MEDNLFQEIEALIFASDKPLTEEEIQRILMEFSGSPIALDLIHEYTIQLVEKYAAATFPFYILKTSGGFQFLTKPEFHPVVSFLNGDKFIKKLSATSMETLSIIAYRQPVTKAEVEYIRGVSSDYSIQKLLEKELICIKGRQEDAIGKPLLYATTPYLLDYLGINDPSELPKLKEIIQLEPAEATDAKDALPEFSQPADREN